MYKRIIKYSFGKHLISILLASIFLFVNINERKEPVVQDGDLRLITYNVWNGFTKVPDQKTHWIDWMIEQNPDVISLQELNEYTPEKLKEDASLWGHSYSVLLKTEGFPTGITSRYRIEDVQRTLEGFHHGLLRVKIREMYFYVIHLHPSNWEVRSREVDLILQDIKQLPPDSRVVLAGDFNALSTSDSKYYADGNLEEFFQKRDDEITERNLKNGKLDYSVIDKITKNGFIDTESAFRSERYQFTGTFPTGVEKPGDHGDFRRLDYVFVSQSLIEHVSNSKIIANEKTLQFSDHLPVIINFNFQ